MMVMLGLWSLVSCNQELIQNNSYGYLGINMDSDTSEDIIVKSDNTDDLVFAVEVRNASGTVASVEDHRTVTTENPIKLQIGTYDVVASCGYDLNAAFENPYYEGSKSVKIYPDRINTVDLTCALANTIFSVEFPEDFSDYFDVYEVTVTNGVGDRLVLSNSPESGNSLEAGFDKRAFFAVTGTLTWDLYLQNKDYNPAFDDCTPGHEGGIYRTTTTYTGVKAKEHYHLSFELGEGDTADGAFAVKVTLDNSMDESSHAIILDFDNRNLPSIVSNDEFPVVSGESVTVPVGNSTSKVLTAETPVGLRSLRLSHSSSVLSEAGLPESVEFVGASSELLQGLSEAGITVSQSAITRSIGTGAAGASIDLTTFISKLPVGIYTIELKTIDLKGHYDLVTLIIEIISDVDAEAVAAYTGWAAFAKIEGRYFSVDVPDGLTFQYRKTSETEWIELDPSVLTIDSSALRYSAVLTGLEPSAEYVFRAVSAEDKETKEITFSTAAAGTIHNLSFDSWTDSNKYPNASGYDIWDSANSSGASTTTTPTTDAVKGQAAKLESVTAFGLLAAGNIFTGQFVGLAGLGAELDWGTSFNSRPIALRGYFKYSPETINKTKDPYKDKSGEIDQCQILMFLTDWTGTFRVNTNKKQFVDLDNDSGIIALGQFNTSETVNGYRKFTLPLVYRDVTRIPNYIVIAAAASRYGDYFTGGVGSTLYIDEFELVYDPEELTDEEFATVFSKVSPF